MKCDCSVCGAQMKRISDWKNVNQAFNAVFFCKNCERLVNFSIRFKEYYDRIDVKTSVTEMKVEPEPEEAPEAE